MATATKIPITQFCGIQSWRTADELVSKTKEAPVTRDLRWGISSVATKQDARRNHLAARTELHGNSLV